MNDQLATVGELSYNNVSFGYMTRTTGVSVRPEYTSDGRTVKYNAWSLSFETTISGVDKAAVDAIANRCRKALTKSGGQLIVTDRAIGDIRVNVGPVQDVMNGPKPQELSFEPAVGGSLTAKLRWAISFCIPECDDAQYLFKAMEFTFGISYTVQNGYTTRTVRGKLQVPQSRLRNGERLSHDSADYYRERIVGDPPQGFKPGPYNFQLSEDRSTLTFDYSHVEMGVNVFPPGVVDATASQTFSTSHLLGGKWQTTITGTYEVQKVGDYRAAVYAYNALLKARVGYFTQAPKFEFKTTAIPLAFTATEPEIYGGRKIVLSSTWNILSSLKGILASGMWQQLPGNAQDQWRKWWVTVKDTAFHPRGMANLVYDVGEDRITDLCDKNFGLRVPTDKMAKRAWQTPLVPIDDVLRGVVDPPTPEASWAHYECKLISRSDSGNAIVRTMPTTELKSDVFPDQGMDVMSPKTSIWRKIATGFTIGAGLGVGNNRPGPFVGGKLDNNMVSVTQGRGPAWVVGIYGTAVRAAFPIPRPALKQVSGFKCVPLDRFNGMFGGFTVSQQRGLTGPIYSAKWMLWYGVEGDLGNVQMDVPRSDLFPD